MVTMELLSRETDPTSSSAPARYQASDFQRLTNRRSSSPDGTPDSAHEPLAAEYPNDGRTVSTADKRAMDTTHARPASDSLRMAQASRQSSAIRKGSWSLVKEEEAGKLQNLPR